MVSQIDFYKRCIREMLSEYHKLNSPYSTVELLFDEERMRYMVVRVGWLKQKRIHLCLVHIDILGEKIVIQCNNTENQVVTELVEMGIAKENISCGFIPPEAQNQI